MNPIQQSVFDEITTTLNLQLNSDNQLKVINSQPNIVSPFSVNDVAVAIYAVLGMAAATLANDRGIKSQSITIDRRHAGNVLNGVAWHFQNHWQLDIHVVHTDINGFFQTADGRQVTYNGAYPALRKIILDHLGSPNNKKYIAEATKKFQAEELEEDLSKKRRLYCHGTYC